MKLNDNALRAILQGSDSTTSGPQSRASLSLYSHMLSGECPLPCTQQQVFDFAMTDFDDRGCLLIA